MRSHPEKDFSVYDFGEEEEAIETAVSSAILKFRKRKRSPSAEEEEEQSVDFLEAFGGRKKLNHSSGPFESKSSSSDQKSSTEEMLLSSGSDCNKGFQGKDSGNVINDCIAENLSEVRASHTGNSQRGVVLPELASDIKQSDLSSDESEGQISCSSSYHSSDDGENEGSLDPRNLSVLACAKDMDIDVAVVVTPDYVAYQNEVYAESQLTFSVDSITIKCLDASRGDGPLKFEWAIADLLFIGCCWNGSIETAFIEVRMKETNLSLTTEESRCDLSGIVCLTFTVCGSQWSRKEQKIWSLTPKYKDLWKAELDVSGNKLSCELEESISFYPRQQLSHFEETLEDVVYPQGDPDAVSISRRDIELLRPETFINDTIIDFYINNHDGLNLDDHELGRSLPINFHAREIPGDSGSRTWYLLDKIPRSKRSRFHFFNSFFFRKLADLDKDPKSVVGGRAAFLRVRKWTRKVNIFEKDYVFIPVNFNLHWSLLVICHPGEIVGFKDEDIDNALRVPCILHMNSIRGSHNGLKGLVQSYLWEEWKERLNECAEDDSTNFLNLRFVSLELPQQENYFDCGLFLLHYVELFLKAAPINFSPFKITSFSNFLSADWFIPAEASFKRFLIRNLLYELLGNKNQSDPSRPCSGDLLSPDNVNKKDVVEMLPQEDTIPASSLGDPAINAESKIELELFKSSSVNVSLRSHDDQLKRHFLESKAVGGVGTHQDNFTFEPVMPFGTSKCMMPTIMENEDFVQRESWQTSFQTLNGTCPTSILSGEPDEAKVLGTPKDMVEEEQNDGNASTGTPTCRSMKESEQSMTRSDMNDNGSLPSQSSGVLCSSYEEKISFISADDCDHNVSATGEALDGHCIKDNLVIDPSGPVALNCKEEEAEHPTSIESEIPENCPVEDSQCDDNVRNAVSSQDEVKNVTPSLPKECEVVPDSPDHKLIPNNDKEETPEATAAKETPEATAAICLSSDTSADAGDSIMFDKGTKILNDILENDNLQETCDDVIHEEQQPKKRRKIQNPRVERKQTRSFTRALSF